MLIISHTLITITFTKHLFLSILLFYFVLCMCLSLFFSVCTTSQCELSFFNFHFLIFLRFLFSSRTLYFLLALSLSLFFFFSFSLSSHFFVPLLSLMQFSLGAHLEKKNWKKNVRSSFWKVPSQLPIIRLTNFSESENFLRSTYFDFYVAFNPSLVSKLLTAAV